MMIQIPDVLIMAYTYNYQSEVRIKVVMREIIVLIKCENEQRI